MPVSSNCSHEAAIDQVVQPCLVDMYPFFQGFKTDYKNLLGLKVPLGVLKLIDEQSG